MKPILECRRIGKSYRSGDETITAFSNLNFQLFGGRVYRMFCGGRLPRLALANLLSGMERADEGDVLLCGTSYAGMDDDELLALGQRRVGLVHSKPGLIGGMTVLRNVTTPAAFSGASCESEAALTGRANDLLRALGLERLAGRFPDALTESERFRTAIAAQLCKQPDLLLIDGLPAALSVDEQIILSRQLHGLTAPPSGCAVLLLVEQGAPQPGEIPLRLQSGA